MHFTALILQLIKLILDFARLILQLNRLILHFTRRIQVFTFLTQFSNDFYLKFFGFLNQNELDSSVVLITLKQCYRSAITNKIFVDSQYILND